MATVAMSKTALATIVTTTEKISNKASDPVKLKIIHLPPDDEKLADIGQITAKSSRTILHIYFEHPCQHKTITPVLSPSQERRFGPTAKQQKERRTTKKAERKLREATQIFPDLTFDKPTPLVPRSTTESEPEDEPVAYFFHTPYLSFHAPPSVLYTCPTHQPCPSRHAPARPVALIHSACFWRTYTIQLGSSLAQPGVIDPRGVISWRHNSSPKDKKERNDDDRALRGYRVRGWRLWGETGKAYVHRIRDLRRDGVAFADPDVSRGAVCEEGGQGESEKSERHKVKADEVVTLRWTRPLSRHTRTYGFTFRGVGFQWKGTGTVSERRRCGWMLRFCHLKLVARTPFATPAKAGDDGATGEVCLATYTSSIAAEKSGTLEVLDEAVLGFAEEWMPRLLEEGCAGGKGVGDDVGRLEGNIERLKKSVLYQVIVATVLCVAKAEKEKRHTLMDLIIGIAENGGNGGG